MRNKRHFIKYRLGYPYEVTQSSLDASYKMMDSISSLRGAL